MNKLQNNIFTKLRKNLLKHAKYLKKLYNTQHSKANFRYIVYCVLATQTHAHKNK